MRTKYTRSLFLIAAMALALLAAPGLAEARIGGGGSFGSRGGRTFSAPSFTPTAPRGAAPIGRSMTQPGQNAFNPGSRPGFGGGLFGGRGLFGGGFLGGLLGAGLFGMLLGRGFGGGLGGGGSFLGLLIQLGILFFVVRWAMRWFAGSRAGFAGGLGGGGPAYGSGGPAGAFGGAAPSAQGAQGQPFAPQGEDFSAFEWLLQESQAAFGAEDLDRLRRIVTPEMASYFAEEIAQNARRGLVNKIADVRLLKGDLSEAWREPAGEFATVAMRFSLLDWTVDRVSGQIADGDPRAPQEATEVWTFRRDPGTGPSGWKVSAIQQA